MTIQEALALHHAGRLSEAEAMYRAIIAAQPKNFHALHFLGVLRAQVGDMAASADLVRRALAIQPGDSLARFHLAEACRAMADHAAAAENYARSAALKPDFAPAHAGHAAVLIELGRWREALAAAERALALQGDLYDAQMARSRALLELKRPAEALAACQRAVAIDPHRAEAHVNRAIALNALHRFDEAVAACDAAIARDPDSASAWNNRANFLIELDRIDDAMASFQRAMAADPNAPATYYNYGSMLLGLRNWQAAIAAFDSAIALKPDYGEAYYNRSRALWELGHQEECLAEYERALAIDPNLGMPASRLFYERARRCDWRDFDRQIADLKRFAAEQRLVDPMSLLAAFDDPGLHLKAAQTYAGPAMVAAFAGARTGQDRLRVGYLSPDFREHPVGLQLVEVLEHHDRSRFEIFGISLSEGPDSAIRDRLVKACDHFEEAGRLSDRGLARRIGELGIDIAVDLGGYTDSARTKALAWRPAPVTAGYLGFAGTTGADYIDYIIADAVAIPPDNDRFFSEKVVRLPHCFFPADTVGRDGVAPSRAAEGLPENAFVFCSFNNSYKITPPLWDIWMRLLKAVAPSVLWLRVEKPAARANLIREAQARGVDPARLVFAERAERDAHIARIALADLFLDSTPYNAHTTCSDALWARLPVLTCAGQSFASRAAASMLTVAGVPELITRDLASYEALALALARDPARLKALRQTLSSARSGPLFDMKLLCRALEAAYRTMANRARQGQKPAGFSVNMAGALPGDLPA